MIRKENETGIVWRQPRLFSPLQKDPMQQPPAGFGFWHIATAADPAFGTTEPLS